MKNILVTGGAGYIGSFVTKLLLDEKYSVTVLDNLEKSKISSIPKGAEFIEADIRQKDKMDDVFFDNQFDSVMHFAGYISVGESEENPDKYYDNNVLGSKNLFDSAVEKGGVKKIIFSSSAAVYGDPKILPIPEEHEKSPTSEYGKNKLEVEKMLTSMREKDDSISFVSLRYFNAAGASIDGEMGESHNPETHIIPLAIDAAINNSEFNLYGTDYHTPDGTCVRDYIHVLDLARAHVLALEKLEKSSGGYQYNVGTGEGYSNRKVLDMVKKVSRADFKINEVEKRAGDPGRLVADSQKIKSELGFSLEFSDLETIVETAWRWHSRNLKVRIQNSE